MKLRLLIISILLLIAPALYADSELSIGGKTGAGHIIMDDGVKVRQRPYLDFVGSGVTCADTSGKTVCTITGGGGTGSGTVYYKESGSAAVSFDTVDFRSGFDTSFSGTEVDVSLDLSEVLTGQATADTVNRIYLNNIDISSNTNLTAGTGITLTGDTVSVTDNYVLNTSDTMSGTLTVTGALTATGGVVGNASTATKLAANPSDCAANTWANAIDDSGTLTCAAVTYAGISAMTSAQLAGILNDESGSDKVAFTTSPVFTTPNIGSATGSISGNAGTATALAANGGNCTTGNYPLGVDASGAVENCTALPGGGDMLKSTYDPDADNKIDISSNTNLTAGTGVTLTGDTVSVTDNYVLNTSDTMSGNLVVTGALSFGSLGSTVDISSNTNLTAGRSLTLTADTVDADAELYTKSKSFTVETPADTDEFFIWKAPTAMTITAIDCITKAATSVIVSISECSGTGTGCAAVDGTSKITCDTDGAADDGAISDSNLDAGDWILWTADTVTGTPGSVTTTIKYTVDD